MKNKSMPLFIILAIESIVACFVHPVLPTFIVQTGVHDYMFGLSNTFMFLSNFLFSPFWGRLSNKYGGAKIMTISMFGYAGSQMAFGLSTSEFMICFTRFFSGIFLGAWGVSQLIYIMDNSEHVGTDLTISATIAAVCGSFGYLIGGYIGELGIMYNFVSQSVLLAVIGVMCMFMLKDKKEKSNEKIKPSEINPFSAFLNAKDIITPLIVIFLTINFFANFATVSYENCFNYYLKDQYGFTSKYNGLIKAVIGLISLAANTFITIKLVKNTNTFKSSIVIYVAQTVVSLIAILTKSMIPFIVVSVLYFGLNSIYGPLMQDMVNRFKTNDQGVFVGLFNGLRSLGSVFGSLVAGFIYEFDPRMPFIFAFIFFAICTIMSYVQLMKVNKTPSEVK